MYVLSNSLHANAFSKFHLAPTLLHNIIWIHNFKTIWPLPLTARAFTEHGNWIVFLQVKFNNSLKSDFSLNLSASTSYDTVRVNQREFKWACFKQNLRHLLSWRLHFWWITIYSCSARGPGSRQTERSGSKYRGEFCCFDPRHETRAQPPGRDKVVWLTWNAFKRWTTTNYHTTQLTDKHLNQIPKSILGSALPGPIEG